MTDDQAWAMERGFWTGGVEHYRDAIDPACVMAFPAPAGIIRGPDIVPSLAGAPRWSSVEMAECHAARPTPDLLVLAYQATGQRDGAAPYRALCTSTYRRAENGWRLIQHQQTPA